MTWKGGKTERFEGMSFGQDANFLHLSLVTPDYKTRVVSLARSEIRLVVLEQPWQPPQPEPARSFIPAAAPAAPESVMHVSPGMAARKAAGRTVVTPEGQTVTQTPEGDILGAALFAAGMPAGRVGL